MKFGSVCSGIEAASVAWSPLGWKASWLAEIEPFPSALLKHRYPDVQNVGDMKALPDLIRGGLVEAPDVFCGGTPCQAFSVAGLRKSLQDARGNLSLTFCEIANAIDHVRGTRDERPAIIFWENVPGVLSAKDNAFGCFLAALAGCDSAIEPLAATGWTDAGVVDGPQRTVAWRVLDAQYFGLAQRRRRLFVVASARDGFDPAEVLFEFDGLRRDTPPRREAGQGTAGCLTSRFGRNGGAANDDIDGKRLIAFGGNNQSGPIDAATARNACSSGSGSGSGRMDFATETFLVQPTHTLRGEGFDASEDGTGRGTPLVPVPFDTTQITSGANYSNPKPSDPCHPLCAGSHAPAIAFHPTQDPISSTEVCHSISAGNGQGCSTAAVAVALRGREGGATAELGDEVQNRLRASSGGGDKPHVITAMQVRRLTPLECERLQGFSDGYTAIPWRGKPASECPDGPRYKALGNSWAVPVAAWIGKRIDMAVRAKP